MDSKICSRCKESKPIDQFRKEPRMTGGFGSHCKACMAEGKRIYNENCKNGNSRVRLEQRQKAALQKLTQTHKVCSKCKETKEITSFNTEGKGRPGRKPACRTCESIQNRARAEKFKKIGGNPVRKLWMENNKDKLKNRLLKKYYNITIEEYNRLLKLQGGVCDACGQAEVKTSRTGKVFDLAVDHCHNTGKVRGLLCSRCNTTLGKYQDDDELILKLALYIKRHREKYLGNLKSDILEKSP
jgi:hypothetical protein